MKVDRCIKFSCSGVWSIKLCYPRGQMLQASRNSACHVQVARERRTWEGSVRATWPRGAREYLERERGNKGRARTKARRWIVGPKGTGGPCTWLTAPMSPDIPTHRHPVGGGGWGWGLEGWPMRCACVA